MESYVREVYDDSQSTAGQKSISSQSSRPRRSRGRQQTDDAADPGAVPEVHEHENQDEEKNDSDGEDENLTDKPDDEDHDMEKRYFRSPTQLRRRARAEEKRTET